MLEEVHLARTNPSKYAEDRLLQDFTSHSDNGAYTELKSTTPSPLTLKSKLTKAADDYSKFMVENNKIGHFEDQTPPVRC